MQAIHFTSNLSAAIACATERAIRSDRRLVSVGDLFDAIRSDKGALGCGLAILCGVTVRDQITASAETRNSKAAAVVDVPGWSVPAGQVLMSAQRACRKNDDTWGTTGHVILGMIACGAAHANVSLDDARRRYYELACTMSAYSEPYWRRLLHMWLIRPTESMAAFGFTGQNEATSR